MLFYNYQGLFAEWEIKYARALIEQFQRQFKVLEREGFDDLMQECLTHWYFHRDKYDSSRSASYKTFMRHVTTNKLKHILESRKRNIRKALYSSLPIDMFLIDEKDDLSGCFMVFDKEFEKTNGEDLGKIIATAINKLSRRQRELCCLIKDEGLNMSEVSRRLNIPRSTLFDEILRIRQVFQKEGLREYL